MWVECVEEWRYGTVGRVYEVFKSAPGEYYIVDDDGDRDWVESGYFMETSCPLPSIYGDKPGWY